MQQVWWWMFWCTSEKKPLIHMSHGWRCSLSILRFNWPRWHTTSTIVERLTTFWQAIHIFVSSGFNILHLNHHYRSDITSHVIQYIYIVYKKWSVCLIFLYRYTNIRQHAEDDRDNFVLTSCQERIISLKWDTIINYIKQEEGWLMS